MNNKIIRYDINFFYKQRNKSNKKLPLKVTKLLNMNTKINMKIDENKLKIYNNDTKFNKLELEKKINCNLNKLAEENIENIYKIISVILNERKEILLDYTIKNLLNKAISQPIYSNLYAKFYKKFYDKETKKIFIKLFNDLINLLENKLNYNDDKNYESFCNYIKDKTRFIGLFNFISELYHIRIINKQQILYYNKYLIDKMKNDQENVEKYFETLYKFSINIKDKKIITNNLKNLNEVRDNEKNNLGMKYKFMLIDLKELL